MAAVPSSGGVRGSAQIHAVQEVEGRRASWATSVEMDRSRWAGTEEEEGRDGLLR
jgi:hypothetical protein